MKISDQKTKRNLGLLTLKLFSIDISSKFVKFVVMEIEGKLTTLALEKKAVNAALNQEWKQAIELNLLILETTSNDLKAKMRLGKAYLQTRDFKKAEKLFREILKADPINTIAKKNLELSKQHKKGSEPVKLSSTELIKEPGTRHIESMEITDKKLTADDFHTREELEIKINKASANVLRKGKIIGKLVHIDLINRLNIAKHKKIGIEVAVIGGRENLLKVLLKSTAPVFRAEKQELKPYMKKGTLDDSEESENEVEEAE